MARYNVNSDMSARINLAEAARSEAAEAAHVLWHEHGIRALSENDARTHADAAFDVALDADPEERIVEGDAGDADASVVPWVDDPEEARGWYSEAYAAELQALIAAYTEMYASDPCGCRYCVARVAV